MRSASPESSSQLDPKPSVVAMAASAGGIKTLGTILGSIGPTINSIVHDLPIGERVGQA